MSGGRWVVRQAPARNPDASMEKLGGYLRTWTSERLRWNLFQRDAEKFITKQIAQRAAKVFGGRVVRLVSRDEAVERAERRGYLRALGEVRAALLEEDDQRCIQYVTDAIDVVDRLVKEVRGG